jgi:hypothetical protein
MPQTASLSARRRSPKSTRLASGRRTEDALSIAQEQGLLSGGKTLMVRGRMPSLLVERAKKKTGIQSDSKLIEAALANLAVADDYAEWLLSQSGTVSKDLDLEF